MEKKHILTKKTEAAQLYLVELENKIDYEKNTVDFEPVFSAFIEDAQVYDSFDQALEINLLIDSQCELEEYKMKNTERILRVISLILEYTVIIPLYFLTLIASAPLNILSNLLRYENFKNYTLPDQVLRTSGTGFHSIGFLKIWLIIVLPIINPFFEAWGAYRRAKF